MDWSLELLGRGLPLPAGEVLPGSPTASRGGNLKTLGVPLHSPGGSRQPRSALQKNRGRGEPGAAERFWKGRSPIGKRLRWTTEEGPLVHDHRRGRRRPEPVWRRSPSSPSISRWCGRGAGVGPRELQFGGTDAGAPQPGRLGGLSARPSGRSIPTAALPVGRWRGWWRVRWRGPPSPCPAASPPPSPWCWARWGSTASSPTWSASGRGRSGCGWRWARRAAGIARMVLREGLAITLRRYRDRPRVAWP